MIISNCDNNRKYSINGMPVIALILFPVTYEAASQLGHGYKKRLLSKEEQMSVCSRLSEELNVAVVPLTSDGMDQVFEMIVGSLSE